VGRIRAWWERYRKWIIVLMVVYAAVVLALILLTNGSQNEPFRYQIF
jgi:hypothetical protein